jgi:nickel/cobalt transporter (NicO) family protein
MTDTTIIGLVTLAAGLGVFHTLVGPDHYLPFVMIARARNWSLARTNALTFVCGLGHVLSSVVLGFVGIAFIALMGKIEWLEGARGSLAAWMVIAFGLVYMVWGVRQAIRNKTHTHGHHHVDGEEHLHEHAHVGGHTHVHDKKKSITPWVLFIIFIFGPCEVLIPTLMVPAAEHNYRAVALIATVFGIATIGTMLVTVTLATSGLKLIRLGRVERFSHIIAGAVIAGSGVAMKLLGL